MKVERPFVPGAAPKPDTRAELRRLSHQLEAVFLNQLFQAMRSSVPRESGTEGAGGEMFQAMFDEHVAAEAAARAQRGLGEALYRQLARRFAAPSDQP
jgi:Rod binding domain-containing protein